ncbi:anti-sigma factor family protein [Chthoniobacter flavus]|uniref:anti-sigma factor family protein n=1 Tax=Chthoniobacter flavus TaxID=191863 RepID=UPI00067991DB|nr:hypothetical protein [Chthoniobacter flavus]
MSSAPADHQPSFWLSARIAGVVWRVTPDCREVTRLTSEDRDRELPFTTRTQLGLHRWFCKDCARYAAQLDLIRDAAQRLPEHLAKSKQPVLAGDARSRLKQALRERIRE